MVLLGSLLAACSSNPPGASVDDDTGIIGDVGGDVGDTGSPDVSDTPSDTLDAGADLEDGDGSGEPDTIDLDGIDVDEDAIIPSEIAAVDTILSSAEAAAGTTVVVTCQGIDPDGEPVTIPATLTTTVYYAPSDTYELGETPFELIPTQAGTIAAACAIPSLGIIDDSPAELTVVPGAPAIMAASLSEDQITAGEFVEVFCEAWDAWGNAVYDFEATILTAPFGDGIEVEREFVSATRAGLYQITCDAAGVAEVVPAELEVAPGLPASASMSLLPERGVYAIGEVVEILYSVADEYGNPLTEVPVSFASLPSVPSFSEGRFRFNAEGTFTLSLIVPNPTATGSPLLVQRDVIVNSEGPGIACTSPGDASFARDVVPGATIAFRGRVADPFGVSALTVNGGAVDVAADGTFSAPVTTRFGINFVELIGTDSFGFSSRQICAFLVAESNAGRGFVTSDGFLRDTVTLGVTQEAFDDRVRTDGLDSIDDILHAILNSAGLRNTIHSSLASNPRLYDQCVLDTWFGCAVRVSVTYQNLEISGPNEAALTLVDGGMRAVATVRGIRVWLGVGGTFGTNGWARLNDITIDLTFNTVLEGNRPRVTMRSLNDVRVGGVDSDFSGLVGWIVDIVVDLFEGTIRNLIRDQVRDFVQTQFNEALDGIVSGLDLGELPLRFDVPRLDGGPSLPVSFGLGFSLVDVNPARALFAFQTRVQAGASRVCNSPGDCDVPIPPGALRHVPGGTRTLGAGVAIGFLNQVLYGLWREGFFNASIGGELIGGGVAGDSIAVLTTSLPPVVAGTADNSVIFMLGGARATVVIPGVIDTPLAVKIGAVATSGFDLLPGDNINFRDIVVTELYFVAEDVAIDPTTAEILEDFLRDLVQYIVDDSINGALPVLPIPAFDVPADLAEFGIPVGTRLGVSSPRLFNNVSHFVVEGNFGSR
jgi:hypothetical protein